MIAAFLVLALASAPAGPIDFGKAEIQRACEAAGISQRLGDLDVRMAGSGEPESFSLSFEGGKAVIAAADAIGAMYGCEELAERIRQLGERAWSGEPLRAAPWLRDRGLNLFLTLPWNLEKNDTEYDPAALTDPQRWWFQNDDFWHMLLDEMARARLNWLDLHGLWDISRTDAPNLYAYFVESDTYPRVGVAPEIKAANLRQLNHVIDLAHARGVRVSLMAYEARIAVAHNPKPPYTENEQLDYNYTREVVEKMIRQVPGLDAIGFRIGESGHGESFFRCYLEAVARSGRDIPLVTRSWLSRKSSVVPLAAASHDFTVEIKYNGEQWGPAYPVIGGRVAGWYSYSFEDYLSDSGAGPFAHAWAGNPVDAGMPPAERWPSEPYKIVWQVRANGTHRIFPFFEPGWVRQAVRAMKIGTASGFTVEPICAYYPKDPRYYLADPHDQPYDWTPQRDIAFMRLWGRLGYDPNLPDAAFEPTMRELYGVHAAAVTRALTAASRIVPTALAATCLGPDHRNHAPELEHAGDLAAFFDREGYDSHVFMSGKELLADRATQGVDGRMTPMDAAALLEADVAEIRSAELAGVEPADATARRYNEIVHATSMLSYLGEYYAAQLRGGVALGSAEATADAQERVHRDEAAARAQQALAAWTKLSDSADANYYKPFTERLRMHRNDFHWRLELPAVRTETERLRAEHPATSQSRPPEPDVAAKREPELTWTATQDEVVCTVVAGGLDHCWLLHKPLPSTTFFHRAPMTRDAAGVCWKATIPRLAAGHAIATEIEQGGHVRRIPSWRNGAPYRLVPSLQKPTPLYYSSAEALTYLKPESLTPEKYGLLVIGSRAWNFHRHFDVATQRKVLDAVHRGMTLLVLQQDYTSGRYPLKWLGPAAPKLENARLGKFDPAGALGLPAVETDDIIWQRFVPAEGWEILGNGGLTHAQRGEGHIWLVQARLMQRLHIPAAAQTLLQLLRSGPTGKPAVIVDFDTEGAPMTTSTLADFMNAHDIPFVTLGEVIAAEQGTDCLTPVRGRRDDDDVLGGRGPDLMRRWLDDKVKKAAQVSPPSSADSFASRRQAQHAELMRCLGLDPLPPRTPLNPRITGVVEREGYRIEKLVFESRPGFFVTALLYIPNAPAGTRFPVVMNPHGHWGLKKAEPTVQSRLIAQALHGYLAMVVDSPGWSFEGEAPIERRWEGPHNDPTLTLGAGCATGVYVWDLMRAMDYLETRPEADMKHVAITGASGGGLATVYAFAADERFSAAIPVCYASSLELQPHNGCLCNHVPGTLQVGDRADLLGIRAPAPVLIIGATNDPEFPPDAMRRTSDKLRALYDVVGAADNVSCRLFEAGHGYDQAMREAALGFLDRHLRGVGDGSPVPEPALTPSNEAELRCMPDPPPAGAVTMRDIALERLKAATAKPFEEVVKLNGGTPHAAPLNVRVVDDATGPFGRRVLFTFESEEGLTIPAVLHSPAKPATAAVVVISEKGKAAAATEFGIAKLLAAGIACVCVDVRGTGELDGVDSRLMTYLGTAEAFAMGWDASRALLALHELPPEVALPHDVPVGVAGHGAVASPAAMFATLFRPDIRFVAGFDMLREYTDCFEKDVSSRAIQPRAANGARLSDLRAAVKPRALWEFRGTTVDIPDSLLKLVQAAKPSK